jgi:hypothetical protein
VSLASGGNFYLARSNTSPEFRLSGSVLNQKMALRTTCIAKSRAFEMMIALIDLLPKSTQSIFEQLGTGFRSWSVAAGFDESLW